MFSGIRLVVVTGLSGAGKSQALSAFEDMDFFTMDNLPPQLIPEFIKLCAHHKRDIEDIAVVVDTRGGIFLEGLDDALAEAETLGAAGEILYFDANDDTLVRRYKETRRSHPLAHGTAMADAIRREREILRPIRDRALRVVDTSDMLVRELRQMLREVYRPDRERAALDIAVASFGFKHGLPADADLVLDVRFIPNPFYVELLRALTGRDAPVVEYVMEKPESIEFLDKASSLLGFLIPGYIKEGKTRLVIAVGCTGGMHRSVVLADALTARIAAMGYEARAEHRDVLKR